MFKRTILRIPLIWILAGSFPAGAVIEDENLHRLHREIILLNLVNGLYLSAAQMEGLVEKIDAAEQVRAVFREECETRSEEFEAVLAEVRDMLVRVEEIPDDLKTRVHRMKKTRHDLEDRTGEALKRLESEVAALLTPNQIVVIEEYRPCTVPPDRGRIGQSVETAAEGMARQLDRIRRMPPDRYGMRKDRFIDIYLDRIRRPAGIHPEEEAALRARMLDAFGEVRGMDDREFLVRRGEIARSLMPEVPIRKDLRKNVLEGVGRFLLDPALKPILEEKIQTG